MLKTELLQQLQGLYSAALCDALDSFGYRRQGLEHTLRPLFREAKIVGPARTMLSVPKPGLSESPYQKELEALDALNDGDVVVISTSHDFSAGVWGELLSTAARAKGAQGAIVDGLTRDAARIREDGFPVFARGISPYDSHGRSEIVAYDVPVQCGGVDIQPGDVVFADYDGIVIIPQEILPAVVETASSKASREKIVAAEFQKGRKVSEVFAEYHVL